MVEEAASASEASVTVQTLTESTTEISQTLEPNQASIEATIESVAQGGTESTCNNDNNAADSAATDDVTEDEEREKNLELADELTEKGSAFLKETEFDEAVDCFSRALEIRVAHYGELGAECVNAYYRYGSALLEKAQAEADPFGDMPKNEEQESNGAANGESSAAASVALSNPERQGSSCGQEGFGVKDTVEDGEECQDDASDGDGDADADEDESDLDMAWKMLDIARAITDKQSTETMEKVDILCALAEISLEREDTESSLSDYKTALSILERLVEPDSRHLAELNFRICICLDTGSQPQEAIPYCQKSMLICKSRMERLTNEIKGASVSATSSTVSELEEGVQQSSNVLYTDESAPDKEAEIRVLSGLLEDLEKKLEDLKQQAENPKQLLAELMGMATSAKANASDNVVAAPAAGAMSSSRMGTVNTRIDLESPTVSTAHTGAAGVGTSVGVTNLGVVGRGVKRVLMNTTSVDSSASKKPALDSSNKPDGIWRYHYAGLCVKTSLD